MPATSRRGRAPDARWTRTQRDDAVDGAGSHRAVIEPRDGKLYVFMPPLERLEDYLELIAAIEATARELAAGAFEGYGPPHDPRVEVIKVTPDPGVIEVNVHPAQAGTRRANHDRPLRGSPSSAARHREVHARRPPHRHRRRQSRRARRRDAGGNPVPAPSRPAAEPDAYWQNHPSLSYMFSGLFIGPTSQAPRVDEGRRDALYELEIALSQVPPVGMEPPPVARRPVFRTSAGRHHRQYASCRNLHRQAVFRRMVRPAGWACVEFRAFEMPPHRADEPGAAASGARAARPVLARAAERQAGALGHRRCTTASCCRISSGRTFAMCSTS